MTLIEILVSMAVIAVLLAGLFAVSSYIETQIKIRRTQTTMNLLVAALDAYRLHQSYDTKQKFPLPVDGNDLSYNSLAVEPEAKNLLDQLNRKAMKKKDEDVRFIDGWGNEFIYQYAPGDNAPVIISAGPDQKFATTQDNIVSKGL